MRFHFQITVQLLAASMWTCIWVGPASAQQHAWQLGTASPHRGEEAQNCPTSAFSGTYLYLTSGFQFTGSGDGSLLQSYPFLAIGRLIVQSSKLATATGIARQVLSGNNELHDETFSAKYVVDPDEHCLIRLTLSQCDKGSCTDQTTLLVVSPNGNQALSVGGVDNQVAKGEFIRVADHEPGVSCKTSTLKGTYQFQTFGYGFDPTLNSFQTPAAYPFTSAGVVTAKDGNFSFHDWADCCQTSLRRDYTALYDLDSDCSGTLRQPDPSYPTASIFASADGAAFVLLQNETDAPVAGFAKHQ